MSLVGTRPPTLDEWEKYELHHRARLAIKPGITGMWQVSGRSDITDFEEVVKLDMLCFFFVLFRNQEFLSGGYYNSIRLIGAFCAIIFLSERLNVFQH